MNDEEGIYYSRESYVGFWTRLLIDIIDIFIILILSFLVSFAFLILASIISFEDRKLVWVALLLILMVVWFLYFVILKGSKIRTIGYMICNAKIVNLKGEIPGFFSLTLRLVFALLGPINTLFDLIWLSGDKHRQALRDKIAQTYVIKKDVQPIGKGKLVYCIYDVLGYNMVIREVKTENTPVLKFGGQSTKLGHK
jgi:uncharacterized RDD family membrane protein YckC